EMPGRRSPAAHAHGPAPAGPGETFRASGRISLTESRAIWLNGVEIFPGIYPAMSRAKALVVHPESGIRALLERLISSFGYHVVAVGTGTQAVDHVASGDVSVVLLDLGLPDMSGTDALRALRAMAQAPEVVVTTGHGTVDAAAEAA